MTAESWTPIGRGRRGQRTNPLDAVARFLSAAADNPDNAVFLRSLPRDKQREAADYLRRLALQVRAEITP